jgi:DNA-binding transcriptional ArsR family regulator
MPESDTRAGCVRLYFQMTILLISDIVKTGDPMKKPSARKKTAAIHKPLEPAQLQAVAELFGLLGEVSRLRILQVLQDGPANVGELVIQSGLKQANVSKQLGMLQSAGIVGRVQQGNSVIYSIRMPVVYELCTLVCRDVARQAAERAAALGA